MNILEIKKAVRDNLRLKKTDLEPGSEREMLLVTQMARKAEEAMKAAQRDQPKMTRADAWKDVQRHFLTAPDAPFPDPDEEIWNDLGLRLSRSRAFAVGYKNS